MEGGREVPKGAGAQGASRQVPGSVSAHLGGDPKPVAPPFSNPGSRFGSPAPNPRGDRGLKVSGHEQVPDGDWQAPGRAARAMSVPQAARRVSGCHPRAKERRRHPIKGQRTSRAGGGPGSARVHTRC